MNIQSGKDSVFSIATLLYARLRKVSSRVVDVTYLLQDHQYAQHVMGIALETRDEELANYVERLRIAMGFDDEQNQSKQLSSKSSSDSSHVSFSLF